MTEWLAWKVFLVFRAWELMEIHAPLPLYLGKGDEDIVKQRESAKCGIRKGAGTGAHWEDAGEEVVFSTICLLR